MRIFRPLSLILFPAFLLFASCHNNKATPGDALKKDSEKGITNTDSMEKDHTNAPDSLRKRAPM